jgi:hypothetical protein
MDFAARKALEIKIIVIPWEKIHMHKEAHKNNLENVICLYFKRACSRKK